ncbi:MAG: hypothetical protein ABFD89_16610 [Bryobacteraceae bacterium]
MFIYTIGDILGLIVLGLVFLFAICLIAAVYLEKLKLWHKQRSCRHDFKIDYHSYYDGKAWSHRRCTKCDKQIENN